MKDEWDEYVVESKDEWDQYAVQEPPKTATMEPQNVLGQVFNVPGAAIRSAIQGKGYAQGAIQPSAVPSFQNLALQNFAPKTQSVAANFVGGLPASTLGLGADVLTQPADIVPMLAGQMPTTKRAAMALGKSISNKMPRLMTNKWLVNQAKSVKNVVDQTLTGFRNQYKSILGKFNENTVTGLEGIPKDVLAEFDLGDSPTVGKLWEVRNTLMSDIADSAWDRPGFYKKIKPRQEDLKNAVQKIKAVVLNNLDKETRNKLLELDPQYEEVIKTGRKLIRTVYEPQSDSYKVKPLINIFRDPENAGAKEAFERFAKFGKGLKKVSKDVDKYVARQKVKKFAAEAVGGGVVLYGLHRAITDRTMGPK